MPRKGDPPRVAKWEIADCYAIKALARGDASPEQQRRALDWILQKAAITYDDTYVSGVDGGDSDFNQGKRSVGLQIVKLMNMPADVLKKIREQDGRSSASEQPG